MSPEQRQQIKQFMEEAEKDKERQRQLLKNQCLIMRESTKNMDVIEIEDKDIPSSSEFNQSYGVRPFDLYYVRTRNC